MRDAIMLKKDLMASLPPDRQEQLRKLITDSFNTETPDIEDDDDAMDQRVSISHDNVTALLRPWSKKKWKSQHHQQQGGGDANETTPLV